MAGQARGPVFVTPVTVSIYDSTCQRTLLDWTSTDLVDKRATVDALYKMALALCDPTIVQHINEVSNALTKPKWAETKTCSLV